MRTLLLAAVLALVARVPHASPAAGVSITGEAFGVVQGKKAHATGGVFVWLVDLDHKPDAKTTWPAVDIKQINTSFQPNVVVVPKGTVVGFPNTANITHNVFSPDPYFDLGRYGQGKSATRPFNVATPAGKEIQIYCDIHSCMWARIKVVEVMRSDFIQPVDDKTGTYRFDNVPPGKYEVRAWAVASEEARSEDIVVTNKSVSVPEVLHVPLGTLDTRHNDKNNASYDTHPPYPGRCP